MGYLGNRPTAVPLTSADIQDGVITAADLGANSVDSSELVDGSVDLGHLSASGTASSSTFLRGDNSWVAAGGDLSFGGDTFGADKTIGSNDTYSLSFETDGTERLKLHSDGRGLSQFTAKAWCYANGTGTPAIVDSHNISSLSDHETGQLGMNFTNSMASNNYVPIVNAWQGYAATFGAMDTYTHTFKATCSNGSAYADVNRVNILVFGD